MNKLTTGMLAGALSCTSLQAEEDCRQIFDGATLKGWHIMEMPADSEYHATAENFFVKDGALHCYQLKNRKGGLLLTDAQYDDFELMLEIKSDWGCDSGIFLRCTENGRGIQVLNDYLKRGCVGFLFGQGTGGYISRPIALHMEGDNVVAQDVYDAVEKDKLVYAIDAAGWNKLWKHSEWNTIKIRCTGIEPEITTWINGVKVMEMDGTTYAARHLKEESKQNWNAPSTWNNSNVQKVTGGKGSIAVQIHPGGRWKPGGSAMYRNIRIRKLK